MKRSITGWMHINIEDRSFIRIVQDKPSGSDDIPVTITFDDGKPNTKTIWEWMYRDDDIWCIADSLMDEETAAKSLFAFQHKKLRSFEIETNE